MKTRCNINIELNTGYYMQLPKLLFSDKFKSLNSDTKLIYALLRDRHQISAYKKMSNSKGEIFVIFPREKIAEILNLSLPTVRKSIKNLIEVGLIEEERQGLNKPNLIYLLQIQEFENSDFNTNKDMCFEVPIKNIELDPSPTPILVDETIPETNVLSEEKIINFQAIKDISDSKNFSLQDIHLFSKRNNFHSGEKKHFTPEEKNISGSIINKSLINISLNNLSNQSYYDVIDKIKTQIDYSVLKNKENHKKYLDLIVDIMANINCSTKDVIIGKVLRTIEIVKNRISSLNQFHIEYVIECLEESNIEIQNINQYILTALFNAPSTMEFYYCNKIKTMLG